MGTSMMASALVVPSPRARIVIVAFAPKFQVDPSWFHCPPLNRWLTVTVPVPPSPVMSYGTLVRRLGHSVHQANTWYSPGVIRSILKV